MPVPDKALVQRVLTQHDRDIVCRQAIEAGWKAVKEKHPDLAWWRRKGTRAHVMWENTVDLAINSLADKPGVKHIPHYDTASFLFDDSVLARFKVATVGLLTSNYPTPLARLFDHHEKDLFGFSGYHRIEIVHVFNRFGTALDWIGVVARERRKVIWDFELRVGGAVVEKLPIKPMTQPAAARVLRPAKPADEKKSEEDKKDA